MWLRVGRPPIPSTRTTWHWSPRTASGSLLRINEARIEASTPSHSYSSFLPAGLSKERRRGSSQAWSRRSLRLETCRAVGFVGSSWRSRPTRAARIDVPQDTHRPATNPSFNRTNDLGRPSHGTMRLNRLTNYSDVGGHASTIRISRSSSQRVCGFPSLPPRRICHGVARIRRICRN